jgi:hypothetical protein
MLIFVNEDRAYLSWLAHHRHGYVLDMLRKPTRKQPVIHRATCGEIKPAKTKKTHCTTGRHLKACSLDVEELLSWAQTECETAPVDCEHCSPTDESAALAAAHEKHLTPLGKDIIDYIVGTAVVCLDSGGKYHVSVGDVAGYLDKTPAQITSALLRLVEDDFLRIEGTLDVDALPSQQRVFPTAAALRTLPAFEQMSEARLRAEMEQLEE